MHGTVLKELEKYVDARLGPGSWATLRTQAGIAPQRTYDLGGNYPDEEVGSLVATASRITGVPAAALLEDFGEFMAPNFLAMYQSVIEPGWRTLDVIEHTESTIHAVVRLDHRGAAPPFLQTTRNGPNEVVITYTSPRRLCSVAKGITRGIARCYHEHITVRDERCMQRGDGECVLVVEKED